MSEQPGLLRQLLTHRITRGVAAGSVVLAGLAMLVLAIAVSDCSFAGGRCPADPVPWWEDDVFGIAATGLAMVVAAPMLERHRGVRTLELPRVAPPPGRMRPSPRRSGL